MRVQIIDGVFHEGRPLMPPEIHDLPDPIARMLIRDHRARPLADDIEDRDPTVQNREPRKRVRSQ